MNIKNQEMQAAAQDYYGQNVINFPALNNPANEINTPSLTPTTAELEEALANNRFELHYQPLFDMETQQILGAEALIRLNNRDGELIAPNDFISTAEKSGLILPIGRWVLKEACEQLKQWHEMGHDHLRISVNVSPLQLADPSFITYVIDTVYASGIDYSDLELEVTENHLIEPNSSAESALKILTEIGVRIAIDDFGTGFSALTYLTRMSWTTLKLDRTIVSDIEHNPASRSIVTAMISMTNDLGLHVIAEGVETEAQCDLLRQAGCHSGQGFSYAKPQTAEGLKGLLINGKKPH